MVYICKSQPFWIRQKAIFNQNLWLFNKFMVFFYHSQKKGISMKNQNIGYVAGKIQGGSKSYISGKLNDKNGTKEVAQLVYDLDILGLDGNTHTLRTPYENIANQETYLHFFHDEDNVILDAFKCHSEEINYLSGSLDSGSIKFFSGASIFLAIALFLFSPLLGLMIPFQSGVSSLGLSILTTLPVALDTIAIVISGIIIAVSLHEGLFSNIPKHVKYSRYKAFKHNVALNNEKIKATIFK